MSKTQLKQLLKQHAGISIWKLEREAKAERRLLMQRAAEREAIASELRRMEAARGVHEDDEPDWEAGMAEDTEDEALNAATDRWAQAWQGDPHVKAYT